MPADNVSALLCKQWEMSYTLLGDQKVDMSTSPGHVYYDFKPDNTFLISDNRSSKKTKGTWTYDPQKKIILLVVNGKHDIIVSLKDGEFIQKVETAKGTPEIKIGYKIRKEQ